MDLCPVVGSYHTQREKWRGPDREPRGGGGLPYETDGDARRLA